MTTHLQKRAASILAFFSIALLASCTGSSGTDFAITAPQENQSFVAGDTLNVDALLTGSSDEGLHGYELHIRNKETQEVLHDTEEHVHGLTLTVDESWIINVSNVDLEVQLISVNNHTGGINSRTINVRVN